MTCKHGTDEQQACTKCMAEMEAMLLENCLEPAELKSKIFELFTQVGLAIYKHMPAKEAQIADAKLRELEKLVKGALS